MDDIFCMKELFLSTPSARRATPQHLGYFVFPADFYPRPPRGGRRLRRWCGQHNSDISIHALREEGDDHGWLTPDLG